MQQIQPRVEAVPRALPSRSTSSLSRAMASDAVSDLRRLLARRLSRSEIGLLTEDVLQRMVEKEYTTEGRLQCATLEGLLEHPTLPFAVVDVLLKAFQPVIGIHLFKSEWSEDVAQIGLNSVNDVRNGLSLWEPLGWAFYTSRLCFTFEPVTQQFIAKILDPSILTVKLVDVDAKKMERQWQQPAQENQHLTFQDIDNSPLQFAPGNLLRPYKRVLNFQARLARLHAIQHKWQPASWDFTDYLTEGMEVSDKLQYWHDSMH